LNKTFILPAEDRGAMLDRMTTFLRACLPGQRVKVTIELYRKRRSLEQNAYLWGVVYPMILREGGPAVQKWKAEDLHEMFLLRWSGAEIIEWHGTNVTRTRPMHRSSVLTTVEFSDFVAHIQQFCAEIGVYIEDPNESRYG